ncbi:hypothetical protein Val02_03030 [Virgisporangium aliadipatigenens]|uniref:Uncharacterized protein n=1 Tax=Virgisporangium aliadipatigenens TaxID=741659 RepID=A0A8J3YFP9_9ACTN|nr:hypothetical protein [Virgisporangium aliadipatigenens]GIJ43417.1 hypothetical protein Val02_03030 [Virgisporangium aliadipatigenens]
MNSRRRFRVPALFGAGILLLSLLTTPGSAGAATVSAPAPAAAVRPAADAPAPAAVPAAAFVPAGVQLAQCGGPLTLGTVVTCGSTTATEQHTYSFTTTLDGDTLIAQFLTDTLISTGVYAPDGQYLCYLRGATTCRLGPAGTYTIVVSLQPGWQGGAYSLSVESLRTPSSCTELTPDVFSFSGNGLSATLPAGIAAVCYRFDQPTGSLLHLAAPGGAGDVQGQIRGADDEPVCTVRYTGTCALSRPGPYRLFLYDYYGGANDHTLWMPRITQPTGCADLAVAPFGDPGAATASATVRRPRVTCHRITGLETGAAAVRLANSQHLDWALYDDAGTSTCTGYASITTFCTVPRSGAQTLIVSNHEVGNAPVTYRLAVVATHSDTGCAAPTGTSWDTPTLRVQPASELQTTCHPFAANAGDLIARYSSSAGDGYATTAVLDSAGKPVCDAAGTGLECVVPATGTYRLLSSGDQDYSLQLRRLSDPAGCPVVLPGAYGAAPAGAAGGIRCRFLDVPAAGGYNIAAMWPDDNGLASTRVYDRTGRALNCYPAISISCALPAAGRYMLVVQGNTSTSVVADDVRYATVLLPQAAPTGCTEVTDTAHRDTTHRGGFTVAGEVDCLRLPGPAGAKLVQLTPSGATGGEVPIVTVFDNNGSYVCDSYQLRQTTCQLVGAAPFYALVAPRSGTGTGTYSIGFARLDVASGCPTLTRAAGRALFGPRPDRFAACYTIPADQHSGMQTIGFKRLRGASKATVSVYNAAGTKYCTFPYPALAEYTSNCTVPSGPVTVIVEADDVTGSFEITYRDPRNP